MIHISSGQIGLESLTFGHDFKQLLQLVTLPSNLQIITLGHNFNQKLENVNWPSNLQSLTFGDMFRHSLVDLPNSLLSLALGQTLCSQGGSGDSAKKLAVLDFWRWSQLAFGDRE